MKNQTCKFLVSSILSTFLIIFPINSHALFSGLFKGLFKVGDEVMQGASKGDSVILKNTPINSVTDNNTLMKVFESTDQKNYDEFLTNFKDEISSVEPPEILGSSSELSNLELWIGFQATKNSYRKQINEKEISITDYNLKLECIYNEKIFYFIFFKSGEIILLSQYDIAELSKNASPGYVSKSKEKFLLQKEYNSQLHNLKNLLEVDFDIFVLNSKGNHNLFSIKKITNSPFSIINTHSGKLVINGAHLNAERVNMTAKGWHDWFIGQGVNEKKFYNSTLWSYLKNKGGYDQKTEEFMNIDQKVDKIIYDDIKRIINKSVINNNTNYLYSFDIFEKPTYKIIKIKGGNEIIIYESNNLGNIYENFTKSKELKTKNLYKVSVKNLNFKEIDGNGCNLLG